MTVLIWLCVGLCGVFAVAFIHASYRGTALRRVRLKAIASALFVLVGAVCATMPAAAQQPPGYTALILTGLCLGLAGDVLLECQDLFPQRKSRFFLAGLVVFLLGHLFYVAAFLMVAPLGWEQPVVALAFLVVYLAAKRVLAMQPGKMAVPVYVYAFIVSCMLGAAAGLPSEIPGPMPIVLVVGAAAFAISDAVLSYIYFGPKKVTVLRALNLSLYYVAQLMLALSIWLL